jgi:Fe-S-cluster-containing dehydrogenase component/formate-dependent nitrite reductase membrane component NrfD
VQLGFVIDHSRCIGCHACTVACKAENDVPVGSFRTWVKYTEQGAFPEVRRSFAVLRCNQCTDAPCVEICPVRALDKRPDGVIDIDPAACIGCKACMQGCPYDALYLNDASGTVEKCHFCVHRTERGLAPACAVVCPTEAIVPGDFHDPESVVWQMRTEGGLAARKVEAGTGPNVLYREVAEPGIDPMQTNAAGGYLWSNQIEGDWLDAERFQAGNGNGATARTTYDVDRRTLWGWKITGYLFAKSLAAGLFLLTGLMAAAGGVLAPRTTAAIGSGALICLAATLVLLVTDLQRPERFAFMLLRPNWRSWLTRGSVVLMAYGAVLVLWTVGAFAGAAFDGAARALYAVGALLAAWTACYTAWLFGQSKGRVLWMRRGLWLQLIVQAVVAGAALLMLGSTLLDLDTTSVSALRWTLVTGLVLHAALIAAEGLLAPGGREAEYHRATKLVTRGPFAARRYALGIVMGIVLPLMLLAVSGTGGTWLLAAILVLLGLYIEEDTFVRAGQAPRIS